jgi:DNA ligase D-like protein (predicted 3'-phosphoesterase)
MKRILFCLLLLAQGYVVAKPLSEYKKKRHFEKTPEPKPVVSKKKGKQTFVIHKHDASRLHYDLRLEIGGVMPSWAVPKGLPTKPNDRRLAVKTEDHPTDYAKFEGTIPQGEYGGGTVMIWDYGKYENLRNVSMAESIDNGKIEFYLDGKKIKGSYVLIHTGKGKKDNQWLIMKMKEEPEGKKRVFKINQKSAKTDKTMQQIANKNPA